MFPIINACYSVDPIPHNEELSITMSNIVIQCIKCVKCRGLLIDERLDLNLKLEVFCIILSMGVYHICYAICSHLSTIYTSVRSDKYHKYILSFHIHSYKNKLTSSLYAINRVNNCLPVSALKTINCTLGYPYLTYGIISWGSTYKSHFTKLFIIHVQKILICSILKKNYREHSHALFICLHLLKLHDVFELEVGSVLYNFVHGSLPHLLCNMFTFVHNIHICQIRQISQIRPFFSYTTRSSNSLLCKGPMIWNAISTCIQQSHSLKCFVLSLKSIVVRRYKDLAQP